MAFAGITGATGAAADLIDMATGGEPFSASGILLDTYTLASPGAGAAISRLPSLKQEVPDLIHTGADIASGGYSLAKEVLGHLW